MQVIAYWERPVSDLDLERNPMHIPDGHGDLVRLAAFCGYRWTGNYGGKTFDVSRRSDRKAAKRQVCLECRRRWIERMKGR